MKYFLMMLSTLCLAACVSTSPTTQLTDSLVIGQMRLECLNYPAYDGVSVNGSTMANLQITIKNLSTEEKIITTTNSDGLFQLENLDYRSHYQINQVYLKVMQGNAWTEVSVGPKNKVVFSPVQGSVYNLGTIQVTANDQTKNYSIKTTKSPELTFQFKQQNTNSKWFNRDFIEH